jgi:transposase
MANQLKMAEIQAMLALYDCGWSARRIALELGINRETVGRHIRLRDAGQSNPASAPTGSEGCPEGVENSKPASAPLGSGVAIPRSTSAAWPWCAVILEKLEQGLQVQRIYQDLVGPEHGYSGSYYSVRRLAAKLMAQTPLPVRRMECAPGAEAQVDFGRGSPIVGPDGRRRSTWVFRIVLSHSRKGYSEAVLRQTTDDFLRCLENAFASFGGVPQTLVIDNLKAAVSRADWFDPELCPKARSFAQHYGLAILPTKPYTPRHKGKIENGIKYVKNNALKGRTFTSLAEQNHHLAQWEQTVADTRIHGTTRQQVVGLFNHNEKPALQPLPETRFDLFSEALRRVNRDGHVQVQGAYYSVGPEHLGQAVWARWDGRLVRLFDHRMQPIAVHAQQVPGRFSTQGAHIVPEKISGIERGTGWLLGQVDGIGMQAKQWAESMLAQRGIQGVRVLQGLLSLARRHDASRIEEACAVAQGHGAYHLSNLRRLMDRRQQDSPVQQNLSFVCEHPIIRPVADYGQFVKDALLKESSIEKECV